MPDKTSIEWWVALQGRPDETILAELRAILLRGLRYAMAHRAEVTEADLEDFVQEALLKIMRELSSYRGESQFTTWCHKICVRVALTELRRRRWHDVSLQDVMDESESTGSPSTLLTDPHFDPQQQAMLRIMMATVERLIAEELTVKQQQAMMVVMEGGMPLQEAAERMGMSRDALYKLLHDARRRLQRRMMREGLKPEDLLSMFAEG